MIYFKRQQKLCIHSLKCCTYRVHLFYSPKKTLTSYVCLCTFNMHIVIILKIFTPAVKHNQLVSDPARCWMRPCCQTSNRKPCVCLSLSSSRRGGRYVSSVKLNSYLIVTSPTADIIVPYKLNTGLRDAFYKMKSVICRFILGF